MTALPPPSTGQPGDDSAVRRRALLGVGVRADLVSAADTARDVVLRRTATGVDLDLVEGIDALCQDLAIGLTTLRGSDPCNLGFGFPGLAPLADQTSPVLAREALRGAAVQLVAADPRVNRIVELTAAPPSDGAASRRLDLTISFEAISGDPATLSAGGMASGAPWGSIGTPGITAPNANTAATGAAQ